MTTDTPPSSPSPSSSSSSSGPPVGLLLSRDLIFTTRIVGVARELGRRVRTVGDETGAVEALRQDRPRVVFVDLAAADLASPEALTRLRELAPDAPFVAFGSHVDAAALQAARRAGCDPVLPRSRFVLELPDLIRHHLDVDVDAGPSASSS